MFEYLLCDTPTSALSLTYIKKKIYCQTSSTLPQPQLVSRKLWGKPPGDHHETPRHHPEHPGTPRDPTRTPTGHRHHPILASPDMRIFISRTHRHFTRLFPHPFLASPDIQIFISRTHRHFTRLFPHPFLASPDIQIFISRTHRHFTQLIPQPPAKAGGCFFWTARSRLRRWWRTAWRGGGQRGVVADSVAWWPTAWSRLRRC